MIYYDPKYYDDSKRFWDGVPLGKGYCQYIIWVSNDITNNLKSFDWKLNPVLDYVYG
jgi:hypothetical protein